MLESVTIRATEETELYCPYCGQQPVQVEPGPGDYYVGPSYWCVTNNHVFELP